MASQPHDTDGLSVGPPGLAESCWMRWAFLVFGCFNVVLGLIGVVVPGMPTTVFLIVALWSFSKGSEKLRLWLWHHPHFGPPVRNWHQHRVIPFPAKLAASAMMLSSLGIMIVFVAEDWTMPALVAAIMAPALLYINTRAGQIPAEATGSEPGETG